MGQLRNLMFIEFIDQLRCTHPHEDSWLVAAFRDRRDRFILSGTLGCPICFQEYPIADGVAYFDVDPASAPAPVGSPIPADPEMAIRAAALLDARERTTLVLTGSWAAHAHGITELLPLRAFAVNAAVGIEESELVAVIRSAEVIPLAPQSVDGVAFDAVTVSPAMLASALAVLRAGGRLVAPVNTPLPAGVNELARDDAYWVGETIAPFVPLRRA